MTHGWMRVGAIQIMDAQSYKSKSSWIVILWGCLACQCYCISVVALLISSITTQDNVREGKVVRLPTLGSSMLLTQQHVG